MSAKQISRYATELLRPSTVRSLQQPKGRVLWIGCSDSSERETMSLGLDPGEIVVLRNLANSIANNDLSSTTMLRYAVDTLQVSHIVVCGHYGCGLVQAASREGLKEPWLSMLNTLQSTHQTDLHALPLEERNNHLVVLNILEQARAIRRDPGVADAIRRRGLVVHGLVYDRSIDQIFRVVDKWEREKQCEENARI